MAAIGHRTEDNAWTGAALCKFSLGARDDAYRPESMRGLADAIARSGRHRVFTEITGSPRTSMRGVIPNPGCVDAAMRPWRRCGAPSAMLRVT